MTKPHAQKLYIIKKNHPGQKLQLFSEMIPPGAKTVAAHANKTIQNSKTDCISFRWKGILKEPSWSLSALQCVSRGFAMGDESDDE